MFSHDFFHRLAIFFWAIVHDDIRLCWITGLVSIKLRGGPRWPESSWVYPALQVSLCFHRAQIYLPYEVMQAYERRNWTEQQWAEAFSDIPF